MDAGTVEEKELKVNETVVSHFIKTRWDTHNFTSAQKS